MILDQSSAPPLACVCTSVSSANLIPVCHRMRIHSEIVHRATEGIHLVVSENWMGMPARRTTDKNTTERERVNKANAGTNDLRTPSEERTGCTCWWCPHRSSGDTEQSLNSALVKGRSLCESTSASRWSKTCCMTARHSLRVIQRDSTSDARRHPQDLPPAASPIHRSPGSLSPPHRMLAGPVLDFEIRGP